MSSGGQEGTRARGLEPSRTANTITGIHGRDPGIRDHDDRPGDHDRQHGVEHPHSDAEDQLGRNDDQHHQHGDHDQSESAITIDRRHQ